MGSEIQSIVKEGEAYSVNTKRVSDFEYCSLTIHALVNLDHLDHGEISFLQMLNLFLWK